MILRKTKHFRATVIGACIVMSVAVLAACGRSPVKAVTPGTDGATKPQAVSLQYANRAELGRWVAQGFEPYGVDWDARIVHGSAPERLRLQWQQQKVRYDALEAPYGARNVFDKGYHTYEAMTAYLQDLSRRHAELVTLKPIGATYETSTGRASRPIWSVRITGAGDSRNRPAVAFTANLHARELVTVEVALSLIKELVEGYATDPRIAKLLDERVVHIVPMANPDGHIKAEQGLNWRKNTHPFIGGIGVDLNRNFPFQWSNAGATGETGSDIYAGPEPASEPETQALMQYLRSIPNLRIGMDYHAYSNLVMWSWGYTDKKAKDAALLETIGKKLASFNGYKAIQANELYPTTGTIRDFVYGTLGIPYFTTEIGSVRDGFDPPHSRVAALWAQNRPGAMYLLEIADNPAKVLKAQHAKR
jgi:predicted deacylase